MATPPKKHTGLFETWRQLFESTGKHIGNLSKDFWGAALEMTKLVYYIESLSFYSKEFSKLSEAEIVLTNNLKIQFPESKITLYPKNKLQLSLTADIDSNIGILCCFAETLTLKEATSLLGKIHFLSYHIYHEHIVLVVFGNEVYRKSPLLSDLEVMLQKINVSLCFVVVEI